MNSAPVQNPDSKSPITCVAAGAVFNDAGEVLIAQRPLHKHQGGLWEFPGGKLELGESAREALVRELEEELDIRIEDARPLIRTRYRYPGQDVLLDVWRVTQFAGRPLGRQGQALRWTALDELNRYPFPAANRPIINALRLPARCLVTPEPEGESRDFLARLERALQNGVRLVQLRAPQLDTNEYARLARAVIDVCRRHGARILLNADPALALELSADGVHLNSRRLQRLRVRPLPEERWVSASCHNPGAIERASAVSADFVLIGPVGATASHPHAKPLGWEAFTALCERSFAPAYALGGMNAGDIARACRCGGQGIAAIRALWPVSYPPETGEG